MTSRTLEELQGIGTLIAKDLTNVEVRYWLTVEQKLFSVSTLSDPDAEAPGKMRLRGRVERVKGAYLPPVGEVFTLKLSDGRRTDLFLQDSEGAIGCRKGFY